MERARAIDRRPGGVPAVALGLALACGSLATACGAGPSAGPGGTASVDRDAARIAELEARLAEARSALDAGPPAPAATDREVELEREVRELRRELGAAQEQRLAREREWLDYGRFVSALELEDGGDLVFAAHVPDVLPNEAREAADDGAPEADDRADEIARALRALLVVEGVRGLDLFDAGGLVPGGIGPVVFRLLDGDGRLAGSLYAGVLRLEASRAARTLTLVLEDGYESHAGVRLDFSGRPWVPDPEGTVGERRIVLPEVDPMPWYERLPELFGEGPLDAPIDDGRWSLTLVRGTLNRLLADEAGTGARYRVASIGGVMSGALRDVHIDLLEPGGRVSRSFFADRVHLRTGERGVQLLLEDGAQMRGGVKAAFLEGRYRIFLPRADADAWRAAGLPGLDAGAEDGGAGADSDGARRDG